MKTRRIGELQTPLDNDQIPEVQTFSTQMRGVFHDRFSLHHSLKELTSFGIGGVSDYFVQAQTTSELITAMELAVKHKVPWRVISGGTGTLVSDIGFPGLVIHNQTSTINFTDIPGKVLVDSGCSTDRLINLSAGRGWGGVEFLAAVPGSIGGAVITNARFGNTNMASFVREIIIARANSDGHKLYTIPASEIRFGPEGSSLNPNTDLLVAVRLQLSKLPEEEIRRRLLIVRRQAPWRHEQHHQLGYVFEHSLTSFPDHKSLRKVKIAGLRLSRHSVDIVESTVANLPADTVRTFFTAQQDIIRQANGQAPKLRLHLVGYWPNQSEHQ